MSAAEAPSDPVESIGSSLFDGLTAEEYIRQQDEQYMMARGKAECTAAAVEVFNARNVIDELSL